MLFITEGKISFLLRETSVSPQNYPPRSDRTTADYHPKFKKAEITTLLKNIHEASVEKNQFVKFITLTWHELGSIAGEENAKVKNGFRLNNFTCMDAGSQAYYGAAADDVEIDDRDTHDDPAPKSSKPSKTNEKQVSADDDWDEEAEEHFQTLLKNRQANKAAKQRQAKQAFAAMSLEDRNQVLADAQRERVEEASKKLTSADSDDDSANDSN